MPFTIFREFNTGTPVVAGFTGNAVAYGPSVIFTSNYFLEPVTLTTEVRCTADFEPDGVLNFNDVIAFLTAFASGDPAADLADPDGTLDFNDVVAFLGFFAGCPI